MNAHDYRVAVMDIILRMHDELEAEHLKAKPTIFGSPSKRHHEIMGASRELKKLGRELKRIVI